MANKAISELPQAQNVNNQDLFVLEQSGIAKKLTAETFITEQGIIDALAEALDGHGGIQSVTLSSVSGRIRTYLITFTDGSATTFQVYDGTTIERIAKTSTAGLVDTYTIFMNDGTTTFFTVTNGADGTVSEAMLNDALKNKAPVITETTESSAIANFTDGADNMVMHNVVAEINPVQSGSGNPSPSNIRPITGHTEVNVTRTGANVWDEEWELGSIDDSTGANSSGSVIRAKNYISVIQGLTYYVNKWQSDGIYALYAYDANHNYLGKLTASNARLLTIPQGCAYIRFRTYVAYGTTYNHDISINYPATDTAYHAYAGSTTASLSWQTEAGTVYGGTIDVATGVLTVTHVKWTPVATGVSSVTMTDGNAGYRFSTYAQTPAHSTGDVSDTISNFAVYSGNWSYPNAVNLSGSNSSAAFVCLSATLGVTTVAQFNQWIADNGYYVVYAIATPQTYQLTPQQLMTILGTNNVWADTGNVSVKYPADTKMFIEKLTMPTEDDLVANQAITSGKYFMIGNSLYLALANIASGAQITIGTNAQRVSLADALNTINS